MTALPALALACLAAWAADPRPPESPLPDRQAFPRLDKTEPPFPPPAVSTPPAKGLPAPAAADRAIPRGSAASEGGWGAAEPPRGAARRPRKNPECIAPPPLPSRPAVCAVVCRKGAWVEECDEERGCGPRPGLARVGACPLACRKGRWVEECGKGPKRCGPMPSVSRPGACRMRCTQGQWVETCKDACGPEPLVSRPGVCRMRCVDDRWKEVCSETKGCPEPRPVVTDFRCTLSCKDGRWLADCGP